MNYPQPFPVQQYPPMPMGQAMAVPPGYTMQPMPQGYPPGQAVFAQPFFYQPYVDPHDPHAVALQSPNMNGRSVADVLPMIPKSGRKGYVVGDANDDGVPFDAAPHDLTKINPEIFGRNGFGGEFNLASLEPQDILQATEKAKFVMQRERPDPKITDPQARIMDMKRRLASHTMFFASELATQRQLRNEARRAGRRGQFQGQDMNQNPYYRQAPTEPLVQGFVPPQGFQQLPQQFVPQPQYAPANFYGEDGGVSDMEPMGGGAGLAVARPQRGQPGQPVQGFYDDAQQPQGGMMPPSLAPGQQFNQPPMQKQGMMPQNGTAQGYPQSPPGYGPPQGIPPATRRRSLHETLTPVMPRYESPAPAQPQAPQQAQAQPHGMKVQFEFSNGTGFYGNYLDVQTPDPQVPAGKGELQHIVCIHQVGVSAPEFLFDSTAEINLAMYPVGGQMVYRVKPRFQYIFNGFVHVVFDIHGASSATE